ncbi:hypothetical protein PFDG_04684 [Plasmodium falciparum Dd2]|uniref:Uncharacterized protein n=1 Tax=Plasmodium falciparum (isolate Dd2) TaxID=57267 RepID=A0A0L7M5T8_PLAF4|nr:hypothetical protein PFDG_04684 [Plasmodium falciparum Dd2]
MGSVCPADDGSTGRRFTLFIYLIIWHCICEGLKTQSGGALYTKKNDVPTNACKDSISDAKNSILIDCIKEEDIIESSCRSNIYETNILQELFIVNNKEREICRRKCSIACYIKYI